MNCLLFFTRVAESKVCQLVSAFLLYLQTCYEVGSNGTRLPDEYMDVLDSALIPVIHNAATHNQDGPVVLELIFHIIE